MHILLVADGDSKYGAFHSLLGLARALRNTDDSLKISVVLTKHSNMAEDFRGLGCSVYQIPYVPFYQSISDNKIKLTAKYVIRGMEYLYGRIFAVGILERQLDLKKVDIIHSNSSREDFSAALAEKFDKPLIWHIREFGDLDYRCYSYRKNYISYMRKNASIFVAVSDAVRQHWINKGILAEKITVIYDGVPKNEVPKTVVTCEKEGEQIYDCFRLVMMGAVSETKGQHQIIQAMALLPEKYQMKVKLDIVGDGAKSYINKLKKLVTFLHLEKNVRFLGYQKNFYEKLAGYDCGIMCSRSEGFGRVTVEYMMAGLPVLASDTGANAELIENGVTGLLYHFPDVENLKNELLYMLEHKKEVSDMGIASLKRGGGFFRRKHGRFGVQTVSTGLKIKTEFRDWTLSRSIINMAVLR